ncbi:hypothetical protein KP696_02260 [Nocardia seriolae]|uniref:Lipoprotein n=1 Tax=Nocardia seriolae TaxID=37332 RepID=A0A0B8NB45_9NOCA|nr:hypothetical protein [Nocardia seriolae]GEM26683.1 hypothetical protein NS2_49220 [Nocardia seriolae NBRC 15557]APB00089.1 hypothetical protein NS506_06052 [Nocardia seriolae]MTJ64762.1 hypothetical protein [Nocardia seriolae]MTJ74187.1 hypothetical protein [Nocardia seriolae]MTJ89602.1 hypothetical protein [Nocardia seriolae]
MKAHKGLAIALLVVGSIAGCAKEATHPANAPAQAVPQPAPKEQEGAIPVGPGPQGTYTVAAQPAPGSCHYRYTADKQPLPDPVCTPGATNPKVTAANLADTICKSGYTASIRPNTSITNPEKTANIKSYGYTGDPRDAEYDHLISLELGGDPNDARNIWVEPPSPGHAAGAGPNNPKDGVESKMHALICNGKVALVDAQVAIVTDWTTALAKVGFPS